MGTIERKEREKLRRHANILDAKVEEGSIAVATENQPVLYSVIASRATENGRTAEAATS